jgi:hypothetical protein
MGRKRASAPAADARAREDQARFDREPSRRPAEANGPAGGEDTPSKLSYQELVKAALDAGYDTAKVAVPWIRQKFGGQVPEKFNENSFNTTKSILKKKAGGPSAAASPAKTPGRRGGRKKAAPVAAAAPVVRPAAAAPVQVDDIVLQMETIKVLVKQLGADQVKRMVDLFGD